MTSAKLPPLKQLHAFESASRLLSFKAAAEELCVTAPAISHQIKLLEESLNIQLFERHNREVILTKKGDEYAQSIAKAFGIIGAATKKLKADANQSKFVINTLPSISSLLLVPNIHEFQPLFPETNIQLVSDVLRANFDSDELDVAIRHQLGDEPDLHYTYLNKVSISPICSPMFLESHPEILSGDFSRCRLINVTIGPDIWNIWLANWTYDKPKDALSLNSFHASLEATKNGIGLAMGYVPLIGKLLKKGELVMPHADKICEIGSMYLVYKKENVDNPIFKQFETWLMDLMIREWPVK